VGGQRIRWPFWIQIWQVIAEFAGHFEIEFTGNKRRYYATLKTKYPDPLEIKISAQHGMTLVQRARHTKTMAAARSGVGMPVKA
jgi:hypothetical protein